MQKKILRRRLVFTYNDLNAKPNHLLEVEVKHENKKKKLGTKKNLKGPSHIPINFNGQDYNKKEDFKKD